MSNLEMRLSGAPSELTEAEKNAVVKMAQLIAQERGEVPVINDNQNQNV